MVGKDEEKEKDEEKNEIQESSESIINIGEPIENNFYEKIGEKVSGTIHRRKKWLLF